MTQKGPRLTGRDPYKEEMKVSVSNTIVTTPDLTALHERGVHFVLCRSKDEGAKKAKSAMASRWQHHPAGLEAVRKHRASGGLLGFIPSKSGLWVADVDKFPGEAVDARPLVERIGASPLVTVRTKRGLHLYYKAGEDPIGNRAWSLDGFAGDVRGSAGYAICWEPHKLAEALDLLPSATPTAVSLFPKTAKAAGLHLVEGGRNNALNTTVFQAAQKGQTEFTREREAAIAAGLDPAEVDTTISSATAAGAKAAAAETLSEKTLANELDASLAGRFTYAIEQPGGGWLRRLEAGLWEPDKNGAGLRKIIREHMDSAPKMQRGSAVSGVETLMRYGALTDFEGGWDADPELAGLPTGKVLDLKSGATRPGSRDDRITTRLGAFPKNGTPQRWLQFLIESLPLDGPVENVNFLKRWCGYTLTGHNREHKFLLLMGSGGNGKSTFLNVLETIMGAYYVGLPSEALFGNTPVHRQWLARIANARCAAIAEPEPGSRWRAGELKELTGGGTITANFMRQNSFDFRSVAKLVVLANDAPRLNRVDHAFRRRLLLMPFTRRPASPDDQLGDKLQAEAGKILSWMIEGASEYLKHGLGKTPAAATLASEDYLDNEDTFGQWIEDCFRVEFGSTVTNKEMLESARDWCEKQGQKQAFGSKLISAELMKRGFEKFKSGAVRGFKGLAEK